MWAERCSPGTQTAQQIPLLCALAAWTALLSFHGLGFKAQTPICSSGCCSSSSSHCHSALQPGLQRLQASQGSSHGSISTTRIWKASYVKTLEWLQMAVMPASEGIHREMRETHMINGMFVINRLSIYQYQQKKRCSSLIGGHCGFPICYDLSLSIHNWPCERNTDSAGDVWVWQQIKLFSSFLINNR